MSDAGGVQKDGSHAQTQFTSQNSENQHCPHTLCEHNATRQRCQALWRVTLSVLFTTSAGLWKKMKSICQSYESPKAD